MVPPLIIVPLLHFKINEIVILKLGQFILILLFTDNLEVTVDGRTKEAHLRNT